jgi:UDP-glucose 4-epimerase
MSKTVIITGALGFIGGHTAKVFKESGWTVIGIDRCFTILESQHYLDQCIIDDFARAHDFKSIISKSQTIVHCAGTSLVGPSIANPGEYYNNNSCKTSIMMDRLGQHQWSGSVIFSSSAAVYGIPNHQKSIPENNKKNPISPYGWSKLFSEQIIRDHCKAHKIKGLALRYFNACGAATDNTLGHIEDDSHMIPRVLSAYQNDRSFMLYGDDYTTADGTCIRDYLHVIDIARAHLVAAELIDGQYQDGEFDAFNLGTGKGHSNREIIAACQQIVDDKIDVQVVERRAGDPDMLVANSNRFQKKFKWKPLYSDLETIVKTAWTWQQKYKI